KGSAGFVMGFKKNTPGGNAGCDACRVLSGLGDCTCRADKAFTPHLATNALPDIKVPENISGLFIPQPNS
ncbi:hypothetical protein NL511_30050, partial [Klebsiella pneumoniae]|nr:hypothetical protein [Klebsiella pneumoniae]